MDRERPISPEHRVRVRTELSAPVMERFHKLESGIATASRDLGARKIRIVRRRPPVPES